MKKISFKHKKKVAFVASGGAVKAACFHAGVCLALEQKGIQFVGGLTKGAPQTVDPSKMPISTYVGSSAGSIIMAFLASGYSLSEIVRSFADPHKKSNRKSRLPRMRYSDLFHLATPNIRKYIPFWRPKPKSSASGSIEAFFKNHLTFGGIFTTDGIESYLRKKVLPSNQFKDLAADLFIVATQVDHPYKSIFSKHTQLKPRPEHHAIFDSSVKISEAAAASTALPPIYQPYAIKSGKEKKYYYDGEIIETLSTHVAKDVGCDLVIASYTHQPYRFHPEIGSLVDYGISSVMIQAIYQAIEQKIHTSKRIWQNKHIALDTVNTFFKNNSFPDDKRREICDLLEERLQFNKNSEYLYIHPRPQDYQLFLADHFNLSRQHMIHIVKSGFKAAIFHLRNYEFH